MNEISKALREEASSLLCDAKATYDNTLGLVELIENLPVRIEAAAQASCELADRVYETIKNARARTAKRIAEIEKLPEIEVPFGVERLLEVAKKCEDLSDVAWDRLKELAIALKKG